MRIALITDGAAVGRDTTELAAAFTQLGHEPVFHHVTQRRHHTTVEWYLNRWQADRPTVVHCRSRSAGAAAVTAAGRLAIPVVYTARPAEDEPVEATERDAARQADQVIASCNAELDDLVAERVPRTRISVVPSGVDITHFTSDGDCPTAGRRHRLVTVGDITPDSGFATAVGALVGLPDTELVIAGSPANGNHARQLHAYAEHLDVDDRLRISGRFTRATLPALLRSAQVVLVTPWTPRLGMAAIEAAACGRPVVATNIGGLTDTVLDQMTGLLVPPHRPRALATAAWKLLTRPLLLEQYGASARDRACARYSWHQIAIDTLAVYRRAGADTTPLPARQDKVSI